MNKEDAILSIQKAIESHKAQMVKIEKLVYGQPVDNPTAVSKVKCDFGKWLYGEDNNVQKILGEQFYEKLDTLHEQWHKEYLRIYNIFFKDNKKGFLSKLLGSKKIDSLEFDKAKLYYAELGETTTSLLASLGSSLRRLEAMNAAKFK
ncbi:MAG: CZB domain-containing protein [Sulfurimonas sp.]